MKDIASISYPQLDQDRVLQMIFHPRPDLSLPDPDIESFHIPVEDNQSVGASFHRHGPKSPTIVFFHGNGEIVSDFDELGKIYTRMGINFLPVDYRGYGRSSGSPTVTAMMRDAYFVLTWVRNWLQQSQFTGPLLLMGRSLGSAPALELAANESEAVQGLIIESGFASVDPLLRLLGLDPGELGLTPATGLANAEKIASFYKPTLIIHATQDQIIDFSQAETLFARSPASEKKLVPISGANHNTILAVGLESYMQAIQDFVAAIGTNKD